VSCPLCHGRGVIKVCYHDGAAFDVGICSCGKGQRLRRHQDVLAQVLKVDVAHLAYVETLLDPEDFPAGMRPGVAVVPVDVTEAGRKKVGR